MKALFDKDVIGLNIILIGPPGAGKGTQASLIANKYDIPFVSSGDLFRDHRKLGTELGLLAEKYMNSGQLVPDQVTINMVMDWLAQNNGNNSGFFEKLIFSGFRCACKANFRKWLCYNFSESENLEPKLGLTGSFSIGFRVFKARVRLTMKQVRIAMI